jgi:hypothetical protein
LEFSALAAFVALWDWDSTASERAEMLAATVISAFAVAGVCAEFAPVCVRARVGCVVLESTQAFYLAREAPLVISAPLRIQAASTPLPRKRFAVLAPSSLLTFDA